jgi:hypothetical protein
MSKVMVLESTCGTCRKAVSETIFIAPYLCAVLFSHSLVEGP